MDANTRPIDGKREFEEFFTPQDQEKPEIHGGFALSHWCGNDSCEKDINERLGVSIRCIPIQEGGAAQEQGACIWCGKQGPRRVLFAKAY
jgi:prolyl-tRNA synthetase